MIRLNHGESIREVRTRVRRMDLEVLGVLTVETRSQEEVDRLLEVVEELEKESVWLTVLPAELVVSQRAAMLAMIATILDFRAGANRARKPHMNTLLRLTAQTQIKDALSRLKLRPGRLLLLALKDSGSQVSLDQVLSKLKEAGLEAHAGATVSPDYEAIRSWYGLSDREVDTLAEVLGDRETAVELLILERIALAFLT